MKWKKIIAVLLALLVSGGIYIFYTYHATSHEHESAEQLYTCPMHPQIIQDHPGKCPICGMDLVPLEKKSPELGPEADNKDKDHVPVEISKSSGEMIGVTYGTASYKNISKTIRTSARILADETRLYRVTVKMSGWIDRLYVNQTGQYVKKNDPLFAVYSPELLSAQQEYLSAIQAEKNSNEISGFMKDSIGQVRQAAREKLLLFDINELQIKKLEESGIVERTIILYSPFSGYVIDKPVLQGQKIMMNDVLLVIADVSTVWGEADIYETDIPYVKKGMPVKISLSYWPGKNFSGRVSFLYPSVDEETKTLKVRMDINNPGADLKIGMYADAIFQYSIGTRLSVPESAVMRTGIKDYVYVEKAGKLIPTDVKIGMESSDGLYEIISGLKNGDRVVTSANFLIDSESSIKAAMKSVRDRSSGNNNEPDSKKEKSPQERGH